MNIKNVAEWLDDSAKKYPAKIAFSNIEISFTYDELRKNALRIGSELLRRGHFKKPVFVHFNKDPRAIACFMGCAYSGNFYVPIDSDMPNQRLNALREKVQPVEEITTDNYNIFADTDIEVIIENTADKLIAAREREQKLAAELAKKTMADDMQDKSHFKPGKKHRR